MLFPNGIPITVVTPAKTDTKDAYGKPVYTETTSGPHLGGFDPALGFESNDGRSQISSQPQAYLPFDVVVTSDSVLIIRGDRYEVDGEPGYWENPFTGWQAGVQVPLKKVHG